MTHKNAKEIIALLEEASALMWEDANEYEASQMGSDIDDMIKELKGHPHD